MERNELASEADGLRLHTYRWSTDAPKGIVQIAHGLAEHAPRYDRLARALNDAGYEVYSHDHRGHGGSIGDGVRRGGLGEAGWQGLVADLVQYSRSIRAAHPELPLFLVGHSMGSFAAQYALLDSSGLYDGVALSGTTAIDLAAQAMPAPEDAEADASLSAFNEGFEGDTGYEWLSRDADEVRKYVEDPLCGFEVDADFMGQIFGGGARTGDPEVLSGIAAGLPILVMSGEDDPLAGKGFMPTTVAERYRGAGVRDVELEVYPGARHEIFNETNRDEVTRRLIGWLDAHAARA